MSVVLVFWWTIQLSTEKYGTFSTWWLSFSNLYQEVPKTQSPRIFLRKECWISPTSSSHKRSCLWLSLPGLNAYAPSVWKWGELFRESDLQQWVLVDCWRVSNWRSLNKSHRGGQLLILMTHPHHAVCHIPPCPHPHSSPLSPLWEHSFALSSIPSSKMNSSQTTAVWTKQAFMKTYHSHLTPLAANVEKNKTYRMYESMS